MSKDSADERSRLRKGLSLVGRLGRKVAAARGPKEKPVPQGPVRVVFSERAEGEVPGGVSLLAAAMKLGVDLSHYCGGMCSCGTCRIEVVQGADNLSLPRGNESMVLGAEASERGFRLACQARVLGPVVIRVPAWF